MIQDSRKVQGSLQGELRLDINVPGEGLIYLRTGNQDVRLAWMDSRTAAETKTTFEERDATGKEIVRRWNEYDWLMAVADAANRYLNQKGGNEVALHNALNFAGLRDYNAR